MDASAQRKLQNIGARIPRHLANNLTTTKVDTSEEDLARAALKSKDISPKKKEMIRRSLDRGDFRREEEVMNEEVIAKIDEYNGREVKKLIDSGELPDPNSDPFVQERNWKAANRGAKPAEYTSFLSSLENAKKMRPLRDDCVVQQIVEEYKGFIVLPESAKKKQNIVRGRIFCVGPNVLDIKEGQEVLFNLYGFDFVESNEERFMIGSEREVWAVIE